MKRYRNSYILESMHYLLLVLRIIYDDLRRNPLRTLLTSLGIFIGISSVVLLSALGLGLKKYIEDQFKSLGTNLIMVLPGKSMQNVFRMSTSMMRGNIFNERDVTSLARVPNISMVVPAYAKYPVLEAQGTSEVYELVASTPEVFQILSYSVEEGKLFDNLDVTKHNKVIVLGFNPAEKIFGTAQNAVGKNLKVDKQSFRVIGVLESKGGGFSGPGMDDHVFIPYTAGFSFNPDKKFLSLYLRANDTAVLDVTKEDVRKVLLKTHDESDFSVSDEKEVLSTVTQIFDVLNIVLVGIATISLVVGGIGIMNIMYVSVVERVGEIGIRRAVGATKGDILFQFLAESVALTVMGGLLGLSFSYLIVLGIQRVFPAYVNLITICLAMGVSSVIGLLFGVWPAKRAADLVPIEAIRKY